MTADPPERHPPESAPPAPAPLHAPAQGAVHPATSNSAHAAHGLGPYAHVTHDLPTRYQRVLLLVAACVAFWFFMQLFSGVLLPFVAAAGIAYALDPFCTRLEKARLPRGLASMAMIIGVILVALLFALLLYPLVVNQIALLVGRVPTYARSLSLFAARTIAQLQQHLGPDYVDAKLSDLVSSQAGSMLNFVLEAVTRILGGGFAIFNVLSLMVVTPVVAFYLLKDWHSVMARIDGWVPRRYQTIVRAQAREVDRILSAWVRGQATCCVLLALYYAISLSLVGLDLGLVVGLASGTLSFIPYVGSITGAITSLGLAFAQFPTWAGVLRVVAVFVIGQILENYVIYPRFLGDRVELPAVWVIFALFAGGAAFGFVGVMLAVPVAATVGVLTRFWLRDRKSVV